MVHSLKWTTGSRRCGLLTQFRPFSQELVVHSKEWTTGSRLFGAFGLVSALFQGASGPLSKVDHWLTTFRAFGLVSALSRGASGPLDGVDHWLATLRQLCLSFRLSPSLLIRLPPLFLASHQLFISSFRAKRLLFGYLYMKIHFHTERRMRHATAYLGSLLLSAA